MIGMKIISMGLVDKKIDTIDLIRFYYYWEDVEKRLVEGIQNSDKELFREYLIYMNVIRNF